MHALQQRTFQFVLISTMNCVFNSLYAFLKMSHIRIKRKHIHKILSYFNSLQIIYGHKLLLQASTFEKQGRATIGHLVTKFRGYRRIKSCMPPTK